MRFAQGLISHIEKLAGTDKVFHLTAYRKQRFPAARASRNAVGLQIRAIPAYS